MSWGHLSISAISQLLLARFGSNFKQRVLGTYTTDYNHDICPGNICPGDICPYQQYKNFQAEHFRLQSCSRYYPNSPPRLLNLSKRLAKHVKQLEIFDPLVQEMAEVASLDESYLLMLADLENKVGITDMSTDSEF